MYCSYKEPNKGFVWPGIKMTYIYTNDDGENVYTVDIPKTTTHLIFNNTIVETTKVEYSGGNKHYYPINNSTGYFSNVVEIN